jgi:hypothetical protein
VIELDTRVTVRLSKHEYRRLELLAEDQRCGLSLLVRRMIKACLDNYELDHPSFFRPQGKRRTKLKVVS